eukprot:scaffold7378_cov410-Prasinococcus_capsulatus_cf.AAC.3
MALGRAPLEGCAWTDELHNSIAVLLLNLGEQPAQVLLEEVELLPHRVLRPVGQHHQPWSACPPQHTGPHVAALAGASTK